MWKPVIVVIAILALAYFGIKFFTETSLAGRIIQVSGADNLIDIKQNGMSVAKGKVEIENYRANYAVSQVVAVNNSKEDAVTIGLEAIKPHQESDGFVRAPDGFLKWVTITPKEVMLLPDTNDKITVTLVLPEDAQPPPKWEFWIQPVNKSDKGTIQAGVAIRWLVTMR